MMFTILYIVFAHIFRVGDQIPHFKVYLLTGIVVWSFFSEITNGGVTAIVEKGDLLRKINFPKYTLIVAKSISAGINLTINFVVILIFMIFSGADPSWSAIVLVPLLLLELFILGIAISFILSALFVRLRDVGYVWEVGMQALFYATPLLYPLNLVVNNFSATLAKLMLLNPVAQIVQDLRTVMVTSRTLSFEALYGNGMWRLIPIGITLALLIIGLLFFKSRASTFAEEV